MWHISLCNEFAEIKFNDTVIQKTALTLDTICNFRGPQGHPHFILMAYKFGGSHNYTDIP